MRTKVSDAVAVFCLYSYGGICGAEEGTGTIEAAVALAVAKGCEVRGWKTGRANPTLFAFSDGSHRIVPIKRRSAKTA